MLCGHFCTHLCSECLNGLVHLPCQQKCQRKLLCGHPCPLLCGQICQPCVKQKCLFQCHHKKCKSTCQDDCSDCKEKCELSCSHSKCSKKCYVKCNRKPCEESCAKLLSCNHPCKGFCGDPCPKNTCSICNPELNPNGKYIQLPNCIHALEIGEVEELFDNKIIGVPECPSCGALINILPRFKEKIKIKKSQVVQVFDQYFMWKSNLSKIKDSLINSENFNDETLKKHVISRCQDKSSPLTLNEAQHLKLKMNLLDQLKEKNSTLQNMIVQFILSPESQLGPGYIRDILNLYPDIHLQEFYSFSKGSWIFCDLIQNVKCNPSLFS